jgi:hypothetical protein
MAVKTFDHDFYLSKAGLADKFKRKNSGYGPFVLISHFVLS